MASSGGKRPSFEEVVKGLIDGLSAGCAQCSAEFPREGPVKITFCKSKPDNGNVPMTPLQGWLDKKNAG
jgi:hypothetical protein